MTTVEIKNIKNKIYENIEQRNISETFSGLSKLLKFNKKQEFIDVFDNQKQTYLMMLKYAFSGVNDPYSEKLKNNILKELSELTDILYSDILSEKPEEKLFIERNIFLKQIKRERIDLDELFQELVNESDKNTDSRNLIISKIFFFIWFTDKFSAANQTTIENAINDKSIRRHEKSVITGAVTLSLLRYFDVNKFITLFSIYDTSKQQIWQRALVGLTFAFYLYNGRIGIYPQLISKIETIGLDDDIEKNIETIVLQLIKAKETKSISERLINEIAPEIDKFRDFINEKLDLDKIVPEGFTEENNPDWEEIFDDGSGIFSKMAEFSKLQMDGSDVFMSAFSGLKNFPFFAQTHNWFLPFFKENELVRQLLEQNTTNFDIEFFLESLEKSPLLCNSDKYSFCLNIGAIPDKQKEMVMQLFKMEIESTEEDVQEDLLLNKKSETETIIKNYIQDFYRFLKLHPLRSGMFDLFETKLDVYNTVFYKSIVKDNEILKKIGDLSFKKKFYQDAISIYLKLEGQEVEPGITLEKLGFAYQKLGDFENALQYFIRAELSDRESEWIYKKIAFCYGKKNDYNSALKYYQKASEKNSEDLKIIANIGQCYMFTGDYENALKQYYKIEYFDPDNIKAKRPIAWCSMHLKKFDTAEKYLSKLIEIEASYFDYISLGTLFICLKNNDKALEYYLKALNMTSKENFLQALEQDKEIIGETGVNIRFFEILKEYFSVFSV